MHEVPGVLLLLNRRLRREVSRHTVEKGPGPTAQLHPVWRTLVVLVITSLLTTRTSLTSRTWDCLHEGFEVAAGPAGAAVDLLCSHQDCWFLLQTTAESESA